MTARKDGTQGGDRGRLGPQDVRAHPSGGDVGTAIYVQEKVLSEIRHELGNLFHKLYYWAEYLKDKAGPEATDATATDMLERTIKNLEAFLKVSLGYFHPTPLSLVRMAVPDVVEGLLHQVRSNLNGTPVSVTRSDDWRGEGVLVDPGHLSHAFGIALRQLTTQVGSESSLRIAVERSRRRDRPGLEVGVELHKPNEASPLFRTSVAGVEWAVAQRLVALHGGELLDRTDAGGERHLTVFLPVGASLS
jgi:signal transduction histidine kinase